MGDFVLRIDHGAMDLVLRKQVSRPLHAVGQEIANTAESNMPVHHTGKLGYRVDTKVVAWHGGYGKARPFTYVRTTHMLGPALERKYAPLRNALRSAE